MKSSIDLFNYFSLKISPIHARQPPNGVRYPRVGGTRQRCFDGTNSKLRKQPENAATPTHRVHAVLGNLYERKTLIPNAMPLHSPTNSE